MSNFIITIPITKELINDYAAVSQDFNPIHLDLDAALSAGLADRVAHGMLIMGLSTKLITTYLQEGWFVSSHHAKLLLPVYIDDKITLNIDPIEWTDKIHTYKLTGINKSNKKILRGAIQLKRLT